MFCWSFSSSGLGSFNFRKEVAGGTGKMHKVKLPNKSSGHILVVKGKEVHFTNGEAKVDDKTAAVIKEMDTDLYDVEKIPTRKAKKKT